MRKLPIVQMGLFMDEQGMPISIEVFPGNTLKFMEKLGETPGNFRKILSCNSKTKTHSVKQLTDCLSGNILFL